MLSAHLPSILQACRLLSMAHRMQDGQHKKHNVATVGTSLNTYILERPYSFRSIIYTPVSSTVLP